ncbi:MAG TPA: alanine racemase [Planctomycetota bacterium]|nr:alanine racemase [Planctomycetota bacterium]
MAEPAISLLEHPIEALTTLSTPRLVVFRAHLEENIRRFGRALDSVVPGSGFRHATPHVKTHKSAWVTRLLMEMGIERFKCTPRELDMLLEAGARDILVAYPLVSGEAERLAEVVERNPDTRIAAQIGSVEHAEVLAAAATKRGVEVDCLLDVDVGQHRTGMDPSLAPDLARTLARSRHLGALKLRGIHAYDGHNQHMEEARREECARKAMADVAGCAHALEAHGFPPGRIVTGGTPGFLLDLQEIVLHHRLDAEVEVSPGTWVYWDTNYDAKMPGAFRFAALLLAEVMDVPSGGLATLNLGYKRWGADQGPVTRFSAPGLEVVSASEEHTVVRQLDGPRLTFGDRLFIVPRHVCSTVNLWDTFTLVGSEGRIEEVSLPVSGRNR